MMTVYPLDHVPADIAAYFVGDFRSGRNATDEVSDSPRTGPGPSMIGAAMLKHVLVSSAVAVGAVVLGTATAHAAPDDNPFGPKDTTASFVSAFDPAAYGARGQASLIVSPYGTSQPIMCSSFHGQTGCYQVDPMGNKVALNQIRIPLGSSEWNYRTLFVAGPF